ncbi:MAG: hypothetical protein KUL88_03130 [Rhizobium sp.]|nr:hypothetical protein [Rhizobium sp.]
MLRRLRGRFGISAPQVAVRTHIPWYLRVLVLVVVVALSVALIEWAYDAGRRIAGFDRSETDQMLAELRSRNAALEEEAAHLRAQLTTSESSLKIEQASQQLLSEKNAALADENTRLKEELAVFERLAKLERKLDEGVMIDRLKVESDAAPGRYRFGFLIALQGPRRGKEAKFSLQIIATPKAGGTGDKIVLPRRDDPNLAQYEIELRNFRRIEGKFELPANVSLAALEFRILEAGVVKTSQSLSL